MLSYSLRILRSFVIFTIATCSLTTFAHDVGVTEMSLTQNSNGAFVLELVDKNILLTYPKLPGNCVYVKAQSSIVDAALAEKIASPYSAVFQCEEQLTPTEDNFVFSFNTNAILLSQSTQSATACDTQLYVSQDGFIHIPQNDIRFCQKSKTQKYFDFLSLGFHHILEGIDHLLFVLTLTLLITRFRTLIAVITCFTVGHSLTLALAYLDFIILSPRIVESCIAFSIVILACEVIHKYFGRIGLGAKYPWFVAIGFGLLHGLGFGGALKSLSIPAADTMPALFFFNLGVELGQLLFVSIILSWGFCLRQIFRVASLSALYEKYSQYTRLILAYSVGALATVWTLQRLGAI